MLFVKESRWKYKNTALSFFKETVSLFNETWDTLIKDVQELKTSQSFQGDICKDNFSKVEGEIKEIIWKFVADETNILSEMLKGSNIYVHDEFCDATTALRKEHFQNKKYIAIREVWYRYLLVCGFKGVVPWIFNLKKLFLT